MPPPPHPPTLPPPSPHHPNTSAANNHNMPVHVMTSSAGSNGPPLSHQQPPPQPSQPPQQQQQQHGGPPPPTTLVEPKPESSAMMGPPPEGQDHDGLPDGIGQSCDICGKAFQYRYQLIVHRRYHIERKPFTCQVSVCVAENITFFKKNMQSAFWWMTKLALKWTRRLYLTTNCYTTAFQMGECKKPSFKN